MKMTCTFSFSIFQIILRQINIVITHIVHKTDKLIKQATQILVITGTQPVTSV